MAFDSTVIFGSIAISPSVIAALTQSSIANTMMTQYQAAIASGQMSAMTTILPPSVQTGSITSWATSGANGYFVDYQPNERGFIALNPDWLSKSDAEQAYLIIHELAHFYKRADNAVLFAAVNAKDVNAYVGAYLLREAEADAILDRAAWELTRPEVGFAFPPGQGAIYLGAKAQNFQNALLNLGDSSETLDDVMNGLALQKRDALLDSPNGAEFVSACRLAFAGLSSAEATQLQAGSICKNVVLSINATAEGVPPPMSINFELEGGVNVSAIAGEDGSIVVYQSPNGINLTKSYDEDGQLAGTITDTPDGVGGMNRVVETTVNGKAVVITQYASLSDLEEDLDGDGNGLDYGDYETTGITIGGQAAVNAGILGAALDDLYDGDALSMLGDISSGTLSGLVYAGDTSNTAGTVAPVTTGTGGSNTGPAWYETDTAQKWGGSLTHVQILLAAMKSGKPLPLATSYFNLASHLARHVLLDAAGNPVLGSCDSSFRLSAANDIYCRLAA